MMKDGSTDGSSAAGRGPKTRRDENFPVASWLTAPALRPAMVVLYAFARAADDIADDPDVPATERIARLDAVGAALDRGTVLGPPACGTAIAAARALRGHLDAFGVPASHAHDLLFAFAADVTLTRIPDWHALMRSCRLSAAPIGRIVLGIYGEDTTDTRLTAAADALSAAHQVLNHLQDCRDDYLRRDRIYVPGDWLADAGVGEAALAAPQASPGLRGVIDRCLDAVDGLLGEAAPLSGAVRSRRLALEAGAVHAMAVALAARLRRHDPLAAPVRLGRWRALGAVAGGAARALRGRGDRPKGGDSGPIPC